MLYEKDTSISALRKLNLIGELLAQYHCSACRGYQTANDTALAMRVNRDFRRLFANRKDEGRCVPI